jgi:transposase
LGRIVVDGFDIANMVDYLSSLFGVPLDEEGLEKFLKKEGITPE